MKFFQIRSSKPATLSSAVRDIRSVVSMTDRIPGSATEYDSKDAVGENLITNKRNRDTSAMPSNNLSSAGSVNDREKQTYTLDTSELQLTVTSRFKQRKAEVRYYAFDFIAKLFPDMLILEINQRLISTEIKISDVDIDPISAASKGKGTIVKFFFTPLIRSPISKSSYTMLVSEDAAPVAVPPRLLFYSGTLPELATSFSLSTLALLAAHLRFRSHGGQNIRHFARKVGADPSFH
ncbi:hypothetical protein BHM03_00033434 [Ensete ventricosum]|nr:hypothetical protein BHM03_00033434 [Ensete ventricosum]